MKTLQARFTRAYYKLFSLHEIEGDTALKWFAGAILLGHFIRFFLWITDMAISLDAVERNTYICWPFAQNCERFYFLSHLHSGYSQNIAFMALFGIMLWAAWCIPTRRWAQFHFALLLLFIAKLYAMLVTFGYKGNFDYYSAIFTFIFLFLPHKRFFGQLSIVTLYSISTIAKIHPSWTLGTYFSSLKAGLPIFGKGYEPLLTNLVIFMEMVMSWFLFSSRKILQRSVLAFFTVFHLYSGTLVLYLYPVTVLPVLLALFGPWFKHPVQVPLNLRALPGWAFIALLVATPLVPRLIPGDEKLTLEGNFYSLYMFEANHQCQMQIFEGPTLLTTMPNVRARYRCDPYDYFFMMKNRYCKRNSAPGTYRFVFDHAINGGPFYRIVDEPDLCTLQYKPFGHNSWIKDETTAPPVARALENIY